MNSYRKGRCDAIRKSGCTVALWVTFIIGVTLVNRQDSQYHLARLDVFGAVRSILNGNKYELGQYVFTILRILE